MLIFSRATFERLLYLLSISSWKMLGLFIVFVYVAGYAVMHFGGETGVVERYTWWFFVTITTVGYGDISPGEYWPQLYAIFGVMIPGIGTLAVVIGKVAELFVLAALKRRNGLTTYEFENHIVVMGYRNPETHDLIEEIKADAETSKQKIIVCSSTAENDPFTEHHDVYFVKGELASNDVLKNANVKHASFVMVHGSTDDQSVITALAVRQVNTHAHMVVHVQNEDHLYKVRNLPADDPDLNEVVMPSVTSRMVQAIQDPGSSRVLGHLVSNHDGATLYRANIPEDIKGQTSFLRVYNEMFERFDAKVTSLKMNGSVNYSPKKGDDVLPGHSIYYIADRRIGDSEIDWHDIFEIVAPLPTSHEASMI